VSLGGIIKGGIEVVGALIGLVTGLVRKDPPKRHDDVFPDGPKTKPKAPEDWERSRVYRSEPPPGGARVQDAAGRSMVAEPAEPDADEAPSFGRKPWPPRDELN
jgi:hypothetical protein